MEKMPSKTLLATNEKSQPGYKVLKEHVTLLLCGNTSGDYKMKPLFIYRSQNPSPLRS